jgi:hypothetical protein
MLDVDVWVDEQDDISDKTKANMKSCLHDFWSWLLARKVITADQFPSFPKTPFELGWRNITDIPTQQSIIEKVKDLSYHINPKIWLGYQVAIGIWHSDETRGDAQPQRG